MSNQTIKHRFSEDFYTELHERFEEIKTRHAHVAERRDRFDNTAEVKMYAAETLKLIHELEQLYDAFASGVK